MIQEIPSNKKPEDHLDDSQHSIASSNWLGKYQLKMPALFTRRDVSPFCKRIFHLNQNAYRTRHPSNTQQSNDTVFTDRLDEPNTEGIYLAMNKI